MNTIDLTKLTLAKGSHASCEDGMCLYEAYNVITRSEHTDDCPPDVSPVLHQFGMNLNDVLGDDRRQELKQFLPQPGQPSPLSGTRDDGLDEQRGYLALDWLVRTYTPAWLDLAGLKAEATALRDLRRIVDLATAEAAGPVVRAGADKAAAAGAAAGDAARAAAGDAARAAAGDAAWAAARDAAGAAAGDAAWAAARDAAGAAAGDAAWDALKPTVDQLQQSAIALFTSMTMIRPEVTK